ncbi:MULTISPECIES: cytochrome c maturation protein CcmE [unclassified Iodidimonas]|jgi:cytochrome c-type biogenesis protein CcmE|uniref:cytochrome c maturation protein CcmE n=1 Tax=unclassified Iodidimonas TaxID=2626145 RepID=UPI0024829378|nr:MULTISPECIES: cytochrome c maturation protein CcmE [unclassified Iodidimonas]
MSTNAPHRSLGGHKAWNRKRRRFWLVILCLTVLALAAFLILRAMDDALLYFRLPSDVIEQNLAAGHAFRLGGLVESGSLKKRDDGTSVSFMVTDGTTALPVIYSGILPDLFREGQGIIADGRLDDQGWFIADQVLAKHDENYMPKEVYEGLQERGHPMGASYSDEEGA